MMKKEEGITLIALIITIIILIILAAVSIRAAFNSGIIEYSINGTQKYVEEEKKEESVLSGMESLIKSIEEKIKDDEEDEDDEQRKTEVLYNAATRGYAYVILETGELYKVEGEGWITFDENNATKMQDNFSIKEKCYQGLNNLCLTKDNRIYNFNTDSYMESADNIESWGSRSYYTKNGNIYDAEYGELRQEGVDLKQWYYWETDNPDNPYNYLDYYATQNDDLYGVDSYSVSLITEDLPITEWYENSWGYLRSGNDLYRLISFNITKVMQDIDIKEWCGSHYVLATNGNLYEADNGHLSGSGITSIAHWYGDTFPYYYQTSSNGNLYSAYDQSIIAHNVNIKQWLKTDNYSHRVFYLNQNNDLYSYIHDGSLTLIQENIREWVGGEYNFFITTSGELYGAQFSQSFIKIAEDINNVRWFHVSPDQMYYLTEDGSLCCPGYKSFSNGSRTPQVDTIIENISIKEWYDGSRKWRL